MKTQIVDTNVILVANVKHPDVDPACITACAKALEAIKLSGRVAIDDRFRILKEYMNKTDAAHGNGDGDVFVKWLLNVKADRRHCDQIGLQAHQVRGFESFPDDPELETFDPSDRKFVAVACAHPERPPILEAADSKWLDWAAALKRHGVEVIFICEEDIRLFQLRKTRHKER
jgi:hypothetical protein